MRRKILPFILGGALSIAAIAPAAATNHTCEITDTSRGGGAAALASLIGIAADVSVAANVCDVTVNVLNNSLNNLLQNADIDVLNNVLNNSLNNILRNADIDIIRDVQVLNDSQIQVNLLSGPSFILNLA